MHKHLLYLFLFVFCCKGQNLDFCGNTAFTLLDFKNVRPINIHIDIDPLCSWVHDVDYINELTIGMKLGVKMWQSIIQDLQVTWDAKTKADITITILHPSKSNVSISATPTSSGKIGGDIIIQEGSDRQYEFYEYLFVDRDFMYDDYVPAMYPPRNYDPKNKTTMPGHLNGDFRYGDPFFQLVDRTAKGDICIVTFHEFGHSIGVGHCCPNRDEWEAWYGSTVKQTVSSSQYPELYNHLLTGYTALGLPTSSIQYYSALSNLLNRLHFIALCHMLDCHSAVKCAGFKKGVHYLEMGGIANNPIASFNSRLVFERDVAQVPVKTHTGSAFSTSYPKVGSIAAGSGLVLTQHKIYMQKRDGTAITVKNWKEAEKLAQFDKTVQNDPYFVMDIIPDGDVKPGWLLAEPFTAMGFQK